MEIFGAIKILKRYSNDSTFENKRRKYVVCDMTVYLGIKKRYRLALVGFFPESEIV